MIARIDNVGVAVSDLARSLDFYRRVGFDVEDQDSGMPAAMLRAGEARLWLFQTAAGSRERRRLELAGNPTGYDHVSFWVGDVDGACAGLSANGIEVESGPADQDWGYRAASLLDPDGNRLFLLGDLRG